MNRILKIVSVLGVLLLVASFVGGYFLGYKEHINPLEGYQIINTAGKEVLINSIDYCAFSCSNSTWIDKESGVYYCIYWKSPLRQ